MYRVVDNDVTILWANYTCKNIGHLFGNYMKLLGSVLLHFSGNCSLRMPETI